MSDDLKPRACDGVEIKDPLAIMETLESNGTLVGLPFMPEMAEYYGQGRARVFFWKTGWLRKVLDGKPSAQIDEATTKLLAPRKIVKALLL